MLSETGPSDPAQRVLDVVVDLIEESGYDAVQLREVARRARVGLGTIYKLFPNRHDLILTAIARWMDAHTYAVLSEAPSGETLYGGLMRVFRDVFGPWEDHPRMLEAYNRARNGPGGERLQLQAANAIVPLARGVLEGGDAAYVQDLGIVLTTMAHGVIARFANGELDITEMLPTLERAVSLLTAGRTEVEAAGRTPSSRGESR